MPLLVTEAAKLALEDRQRGVIEEIIDQDELFALVPFVQAKDKTYSYVRENTIAGGDWYSAYEDIEESASTFTPVNTTLKVLAGQVDMDNFTTEVQSELNDQIAIQLAAKAKGIGRQFRDVLVNGDASVNAKQFDGLKKLVTAGQTLKAGNNGAAVSYSALDELKDAVKLGADALMMRQGTWRAIKELNRLQGGNTADMMMIENFGRPVKAYDGTPVIINDFLPDDEIMGSATATTSIYAVRLNEADGFHGLFGGASAGLRLEKVGLLQNRDATRWRMKWYCGAALKATHSIARLSGITNI
jgi:HK97 family phage major capsid protein